MPHPSQRLSTRALNPVILPILKHLKLSSLLLLSISITIPDFIPRNLISPHHRGLSRISAHQGERSTTFPRELDHKNFSPRNRWRTYVAPRSSGLESHLGPEDHGCRDHKNRQSHRNP